MFETVIKRDGRKVKHDPKKITEAIFKAASSIGGNDYKLAEKLTEKVHEAAERKFTDNDTPTIEEIQDIVEKVLIENGHAATAKAYIIYRNQRTKQRSMKTKLMQTINELTYADAVDSDIKRENANIDADTAMGTMLKYGSATSKEFYETNVLEPDEAKAHINGDIHIHDLDFYTLTTTCCQIDLTKLFKNGFHTGNGFVREPNNINTYAALACIAIQSNQNDQHGGQSIPKFDYDMAEGVRKTYKKQYIENAARLIQFADSSKHDCDDWFAILRYAVDVISETYGVYPSLDKEIHEKYLAYELKFLKDQYSIYSDFERIQKKATFYTNKEIDRATYQAMEAFVHNLNTMASRAGAQVPFSSINYGTDTSPEGRLVIKNILLAEEAGLGNGETPIFPIHIFKVKEGINYNETDPNYDMFKLACKVSAKRLFPNFSFIDAPYNLKYYKEGNPDTEVAYMGCVRGNEVITYKIDNNVTVDSIESLWNTVSAMGEDTIGSFAVTGNISVFDSSVGDFVKCKNIIKNANRGNWLKLTFDDGKTLTCTDDHPLPVKQADGKLVRTFVRDMCVGDLVPTVNAQYNKFMYVVNDDVAWSLGIRSTGMNLAKYRVTGSKEVDFSEMNLPSSVFNYKTRYRLMVLGGIIDSIGEICTDESDYTYIKFRIPYKTYALQIRALLLTLPVHNVYMYERLGGYEVGFSAYEEVFNFTKIINVPKIGSISTKPPMQYKQYAKLISVEHMDIDECSFDVETESDKFDVSGINSHNCRTRVLGNEYDKNNEIATGRGNLSFTSINLPRLGIKANKDIDTFFKMLDSEITLVIHQLMNRLEIQSQKKVKNFPFLMGQGVWLDSDKLTVEDTVGEVLKHGSLSIGFIGLAETLVALTGKHHGESDESQKLGLRIITYMRQRVDEESEKTHLNFTLLATPAEGLSGRFIRMDKERYGYIPGVTDRDYYTNSFHIPVYFDCSAAEKIRREAPYHELTNAGHISYIELNGDPTRNVEGFISIVKFMKESGIGYGSINHPVDRDPVCGYTGIIDDVCPKCGRRDDYGIKFERIRRITGYLVGTLDKFNDAKRAEEHDRVKHRM